MVLPSLQQGKQGGAGFLHGENVGRQLHAPAAQGFGQAGDLWNRQANGGQPHVPTIQSDIHAFAVLTYRIFCRHHPLDGNLVLSQAYTKENFARFYGTDPKFSMGENNNEPFLYALERWKRLPEILRLYYLQVFSPDCLHGKTPRLDLAAFRKVMRLAFQKNH